MKPEKKVVKNNVGTYIYIVLNPEIFRYIDGQLLPNNTGNINKYTELYTYTNGLYIACKIYVPIYIYIFEFIILDWNMTRVSK